MTSNQSTPVDDPELVRFSEETTPADPPPSTEENKEEKPRPNEKMKMYLERQRYLSDLHSHLIGVGNTGFWIDNIIENRHILPTHRSFCKKPRLREQLCPLIWNAHANKDQRRFIDGKCTVQFIDLLIQRNFSKNKIYDDELRIIANNDIAAIGAFKGLIYNDEFLCQLNHYGLSFGHVKHSSATQRYMSPQPHEIEGGFTYDVVLLLSDLGNGLGVTMSWTIGSEDLIQSKVEVKLGLHVYPRLDDLPPEPFRRWIVFNARDQTFEIVKGITVEILRKLINIKANAPAQECILARAYLQNAFSICNPNGSASRLIDFDKFHGSFTPELYPHRFALKDSIYSQRLDILAALLKHVLDRYQNCRPPVQYCELSVGVGDLCRPWVFDVLRSFSAHEPIIKQTFSLESGSFTSNMIKNNHFPHLRTAFEMFNGEPLSCTLNVVYKFLPGFNRQHVQGNRLKNQEDALRLLNDSPNVAIHYMLSEIVQSEADEHACYVRNDAQVNLTLRNLHLWLKETINE